MVNQDDVREAMKQVDDPEIGINVVDLGLLALVGAGACSDRIAGRHVCAPRFSGALRV